ncbi:MAG: glycosyltransferase family 2 protein [Gemmatimonadetes bacterium]|nr:glycosyltransferase family 2 protein [Gemmatimonadota bacterium]
MKLSIIVPVYNEETTIAEVLDRVIATEIPLFEKEVIVADDGSTDGTAGIVDEYRKSYGNVMRVYTSDINLGKGAAVRLGLHHASGEVMLIQDADLELDPAEYARLLAPIASGSALIVYGSRFAAKNASVPRRRAVANRFLTWLTNLLYRSSLTDMETAYKVFRREALAGIRLRSVHFDFEPEITAKLLKAGHRIHEVPISYRPRTAEEGKKISWVDGLDAIWALLKYRFSD